ncbi:MAG TPA: ribosome maturation factor RimM [Myxococcota bacterium]|nr:ribosome maturation factor RimM [Myxococcota bacterium]
MPEAVAAQTVAVGRITRPHGVRGEVRVQVYGSGEVLAVQREVLVGGAPRAVTAFRFAGGGSRSTGGAGGGGGGFAVMRLRGVDDRDAAEALRGAELSLPASAFPEAGPGAFWYHEVVGREVVERAGGRVLGRVTAVVNYGASDVLVVLGDEGEWMLPVVDDVVLAVSAERIEVAVPEGLEPQAP